MVVLYELEDGWGADLPAIRANVHAQAARWLVDHPDAVLHFASAELRLQQVEFVADGWLGGQVGQQVGERCVIASLIQSQALAAILLSASDMIAVRDAVMFVAEWVVSHAIHAAEYKALLPMDAPVQIDAQARDLKFIEQRLKQVGVVVAQIG